MYRYHVCFDTGQETTLSAPTYPEAIRNAAAEFGIVLKRRGGVKVRFCKRVD